MKTLALIPARSGSKGIVSKNIRMFRGKPLFAWAVEVGKATCDQTWVSTDRTQYGNICTRYGCGVILAGPPIHTDTCSMLSVVQDALRQLASRAPDIIVLLQPTQPLRRVEHVRAALRRLELTGADSVVSVVEIPAHYSPDFAMRIEGGCLVPFNERTPKRRQDTRPAYSRDGTVYAIRRETIEAGSLYGDDCRPFIIPHSESVNLDTEDDWQRAEVMGGVA